MTLGRVGASPWYARGWMAFLLRVVSDIAITLTARLLMAPSWPNDVSEAAIQTDVSYYIFDVTLLL